MSRNPKIIAHKVKLNAGGYDDRGVYYGRGPIALYYVECPVHSNEYRAASRQVAIEQHQDAVARMARDAQRARESEAFYSVTGYALPAN